MTPLTLDDCLLIIGHKEAHIFALNREVADLRAQVAQLLAAHELEAARGG